MQENIEQIIDQFIRPHLLKHYGDMQVINFNDGVLKIKLMGQCSNCPSSKYTVENIIENELKKYVSEFKDVVLINGVSEELLNFAKMILSNENRN